MRLMIVGKKWIGGWAEGLARAARRLHCSYLMYYYATPYSPTTAFMLRRVQGRVPPMLRRYIMPMAEHLGRQWETRMNDQLVATGQAFRPDVILLLKGETIHAKSLSALRAPGRRIVSWWLDDPLLYYPKDPELVQQIEFIDAFYIYDRGRFDELKARGLNQLIYLPCAYDPAVYHPQPINAATRRRLNCTVGLVASYYPERGAILGQLQGLDVAIWGWDWRVSRELKTFPSGTWRGKTLNGREAAKVYSIAKICPNVHHSQTRLGGLNMRTFEIPAAGGFELVDYVPGMEEQFELGSEMITFSSPEHFRELVDYYLARPQARQAVVERGRARVMRDHTYERRLQTILSDIGN